jgi:hypothetical protein
LEPLLPLRPLASDVNKPERDVVYLYDELRDAFGRLAGVKNVLVARLIFLRKTILAKQKQ